MSNRQTQPRFVPAAPWWWLAAALVANHPVIVHADDPGRGAEVYSSQCARCHGDSGQGTDDYYPEALAGDRSIAQLSAFIAETMPEDTEEKCSLEDARVVAAYVYEQFYSSEARARNKPARIELSRLTVRQYQNAVADLVGSFRDSSEWGHERGLRAQYNPTRNFRRSPKQVQRIDPEINFEWGAESPVPEKLDGQEFSVRWQGLILAPDTGDYEFVLHTEHAARLWVNDQRQPLIDAYVRATSDREFRATLRLLGGRVYPIKLEFSKAKQGVNDSDKNKEKPQPQVKAYVSLQWVRPHHTQEVIASRFFSARNGPEVFVLQAPFPPDDRSTGYERGVSVSKAWDEATTEGAIEVANYVVEHLRDLADADADNAQHEPRLHEFCAKFAERAFRRPLTDDERQIFVDGQFEATGDLRTAMKRVVLLVLKSPRFLYREFQPAVSDPYDTASRLSFGLWDTLPDERLMQAAAENKLASRDEVLRQLNRMRPDLRTRFKLRTFLFDWLQVSQMPELSKSGDEFAEFTPSVASDLRTSFELAIDELLESDSADLRDLMLANSVFVNGRLSRVYDIELPEDAPFQKVTFQPEERSGIVSHPYLLSTFAYTSTSSPIHRGVFISRSLLGRVLRPPPESVAPLAPDLHPDMTTRERVVMQTKPDTCQTCHGMINPLGFALEHFDAIGRYRQRERNRKIDATGTYLAHSGDVEKFDGVRQLATFLAENEETHASFVRQMFHHTVKQPLHAYGPDRLAQLKQAFVESNFNVKELLVEIVASSASPPIPSDLPSSGL